jgi:hypothetical protein
MSLVMYPSAEELLLSSAIPPSEQLKCLLIFSIIIHHPS